MTYGNDAAQAAPRSSGWAAPQGGAPKKSLEKVIFWLLLVGYASLYAIVGWISSEYVQTTPLEGSILPMPEASGPLRWVGYATMPLYVLFKVGFTAACLALGAVIISWNVRFSSLFHAALLAEIVWAAAEVVRLFWMLSFPGSDEFFYPLSLLSLTGIDEGSMWALYLLRTLNLFEVAYVALLAYTVRIATAHTPDHVLLFVVVSYGGAMVLLVAGVTFLLLAML